MKYFYYDIKNKYSEDNKYLAVINSNGLWIKDVIDDRILIINAVKVDQNFLIDAYISEFNEEFKNDRSIKSLKLHQS